MDLKKISLSGLLNTSFFSSFETKELKTIRSSCCLPPGRACCEVPGRASVPLSGTYSNPKSDKDSLCSWATSTIDSCIGIDSRYMSDLAGTDGTPVGVDGTPVGVDTTPLLCPAMFCGISVLGRCKAGKGVDVFTIAGLIAVSVLENPVVVPVVIANVR